MDIKQILSQLDHNPFWLERYTIFLEEVSSPKDLYDKHHILPQAIFPDYVSFRRFPWNRIDLRPADHLLAHYYLYRALPGTSEARAAFVMMCGLRYAELVEQHYDEALVKEIAQEYEAARFGLESTIKGWVRIYKTEEECSVCPPDQLEQFKALGWKEGVPKRVWVMKDEEQHRILLSEVSNYQEKGYVLGRRNHHTEASRKSIREAAVEHHEQESTKEDPYAYLPRGEEHHRRILGCPDEVAAKIAKTLQGRKLAPEHAAKSRTAAIGKTWSWSPEAKARKSAAMMGEGNNRYGLPGYWKDKTRPQETKDKMSDSHKEFFKDPEKVAALDAVRPRGEDHPFMGRLAIQKFATRFLLP